MYFRKDVFSNSRLSMVSKWYKRSKVKIENFIYFVIHFDLEWTKESKKRTNSPIYTE